jgi:hypothetical protein
MATQDFKPFDGLADLLSAYDALALLAFDDLGHSSPTWVLLDHLNRQLRQFVDSADRAGLVS